MHIVDVTMFYADASGGVRTYLEAKHRHLTTRPEHRHSVVAPGGHTRADGYLAWVASPPLPGTRGYRFPLRLQAWAGQIKALEPDIVEAGDPYTPAWAALRAGAELGVPVVGFYHSDLPQLAAARVGRWCRPAVTAYVRRLYSHFDCVLAPSRTMVERLALLGLHNVERQPLGVDLQRFDPVLATDELRLRFGVGQRPLLVFAGRGAREKNIPVLLETMLELGADYHLLLIGSGMPQEYPDNVSVIDGFVPPDDLGRLLASCDALLHGGDRETFGLIVLEAMASGLPVIGVDAGAVAELVTPECGTLAERCEPGALADAVRRLFDGDARTLGRNARRHVEEHYAWQRVLGDLLGRYRALAGDTGLAAVRESSYGGV